jgi:hypothetical protein
LQKVTIEVLQKRQEGKLSKTKRVLLRPPSTTEVHCYKCPKFTVERKMALPLSFHGSTPGQKRQRRDYKLRKRETGWIAVAARENIHRSPFLNAALTSLGVLRAFLAFSLFETRRKKRGERIAQPTL